MIPAVEPIRTAVMMPDDELLLAFMADDPTAFDRLIAAKYPDLEDF